MSQLELVGTKWSVTGTPVTESITPSCTLVAHYAISAPSQEDDGALPTRSTNAAILSPADSDPISLTTENQRPGLTVFCVFRSRVTLSNE